MSKAGDWRSKCLTAAGLIVLISPPAPNALAQAADPVATNIAVLEQLAGTLRITSEPYMSDGALVGCTLVFTALTQDWTYRQGAFLRVDGNVGIMTLNQKIGASLKVVVNEMDVRFSPMRALPSAPSRAYLIARDMSTSLDSLATIVPSDTPGALFSVFNPSPSLEIISEGIEFSEIVIAFNQRKGRTDIRLPLALDVKDFRADGSRVRSIETVEKFSICVSALQRSLE